MTSNATKKATSKREATDVAHPLPYSEVRMPILLATLLRDSFLSIFSNIKMKPLMIYIHLVRLNWLVLAKATLVAILNKKFKKILELFTRKPN